MSIFRLKEGLCFSQGPSNYSPLKHLLCHHPDQFSHFQLLTVNPDLSEVHLRLRQFSKISFINLNSCMFGVFSNSSLRWITVCCPEISGSQ